MKAKHKILFEIKVVYQIEASTKQDAEMLLNHITNTNKCFNVCVHKFRQYKAKSIVFSEKT